MSMPNAFTVSPRAQMGSARKESNLHVPVSSSTTWVAPGTLDGGVSNTPCETDPGDDLAWSTEPAHQRRFGLSA